MRKITALIACVMIAGSLTIVASPAEAASSVSKRWSGYKISKSSKASGRWIGAYKTRGHTTYRIDPARKASASKRYNAPRQVNYLRSQSGKKVSTSKQARAAWILSKYGSYKSKAQNAAVDVAVTSLLGGASTKSKTTKKRLKQSNHGSSIKYLAKRMLKDSSTQAGPYRVTVTAAPRAVSGSLVKASVRVYSSRTGRGVKNLPVGVRLGGQPQAATALTDDAGRATVSLVAEISGRQPLTATVARVPAQKLRVMKPKRKGGSRLVVAGGKSALRAASGVEVYGSPHLSSLTAVTSSTLAGGTQQAKFTLADATAGAERVATSKLYGPFATAAAARCAGTVAATRTVNVNANGSYAFPAIGSPAGYWATGVSIAGDSLNAPVAEVCGARTKFVTRPSAKISRTDSSVSENSLVRAKVSIGGWTPLVSTTANITLYGPYSSSAKVKCGSAYGTVKVKVSKNGSITTPSIRVRKTGYFGWRVGVPQTALTYAATSDCRAGNSVIKVN